ncbi:MAG: hypothetical protein ACRDCT_06475, partial [Shewanella sp.]
NLFVSLPRSRRQEIILCGKKCEARLEHALSLDKTLGIVSAFQGITIWVDSNKAQVVVRKMGFNKWWSARE